MTTDDKHADADDADADDADAEDADADGLDLAEQTDGKDSQLTNQQRSTLRMALLLGMVAVVGVGAMASWLGFRAYSLRQQHEQRETFIQVGRQAAVNLTTIDWQSVDSDIQRILDLSTGSFYDDFSKRAKPFSEIVKKVHSKSVGTVTEAGLESVSGNQAQVAVAMSVKSSSADAAEADPRPWRMRIDVEQVDGGVKVSNVVFVP